MEVVAKDERLRMTEKILAGVAGAGLALELNCKSDWLTWPMFILIFTFHLCCQDRFRNHLPLRSWNGLKIGFFSSVLLVVFYKYMASRKNKVRIQISSFLAIFEFSPFARFKAID
jgi:hypothetical protein